MPPWVGVPQGCTVGVYLSVYQGGYTRVGIPASLLWWYPPSLGIYASLCTLVGVPGCT